MDYNWEDFEDGPPPDTKDRVHVTINNRCQAFFNRHAVAALGTPDGVSLMYDRRRSVIGVRASPLNRRSCYRLWRKQTGSNGRVVSMKNFCRRFAIQPDETLAFQNAEVKDGILILDLNDVRPVAKS